MKHSIRITKPDGTHSYLWHKDKGAFAPATAKKYLREYLAANPGAKARIENQFREPVKIAPQSYFAVVYAMPGYLLNGGKTRVQSVRFRMKRDCEAWCESMAAQSFVHGYQVHPSAKAPDLNALTSR